MISEEGKGNIYLLVGFFGSGKTTFIKDLLNNQQHKKYAIIQNEFAEGEMGIEQPLIVDENGTPFSNFLELPNGCICCSAKYFFFHSRNDLVAAIQYILENTAVKDIVVETNGLADPASSIKQFWFDEEMKIKAQLHSVICILSVQKWAKIRNEELLSKQICFSNKILLSFIDKSTELQVSEIQAYLKENTADCQVNRKDQIDICQFLEGGTLFTINFNHLSNPTHEHHHSSPHQARPFFLKGFCQCNSKAELESIFGEILWESGLKILRIKGVIALKQVETVFQIQAVEDLFEIKTTHVSKDQYKAESRILFIGEDLELEYFQKKLKMMEIVKN